MIAWHIYGYMSIYGCILGVGGWVGGGGRLVVAGAPGGPRLRVTALTHAILVVSRMNMHIHCQICVNYSVYRPWGAHSTTTPGRRSRPRAASPPGGGGPRRRGGGARPPPAFFDDLIGKE